MQYINVTLELLNRFSSSKRAKELLAAAIWMKMQHSNSVIWNVTENRLRKQLHIGKDKAGRIIRDMKDSDLFSVSGNTVIVSSFRDHTTKTTKKGKTYQGAMVCKFEVREYSLKELYNIINEKLFEFQICAAEQKDCLLKEQDQPSSAKGKAITLKQFEAAIKMKSGSVSRIKKRLIARDAISSTLAEKHSFDARNEEERTRTLRRTGKRKADYRIGDLCFVVLPCSYSIKDRKVSESFRHLIYGKQTSRAAQKDINYCGIPDGFFA